MSILAFIKPSTNFSMISNGIFRDKTISYKAVGLYCQLASLPDRCKPSVAYLMAHHSDGKASLTSAISELTEAGWLKISDIREQGRFVGAVWQITNTKGEFQEIDDNYQPKVGSPYPDLPYPDFPPPVNPPQIKNDLKEEESKIKNIPPAASQTGGAHDPLAKLPRLQRGFDRIHQGILKNHPKAVIPKKGSKQELEAKQVLERLVRLDGYTEDQVCDTLYWVLHEEPDSPTFTWREQFRSIAQLREVKGGASKFTKMHQAMLRANKVFEEPDDPMVVAARKERARQQAAAVL